MNNATNALIKVLKNGTGQILLGAVAGWTATYLTLRIGKPIAFGAGIGVLGYHIAIDQGYLKPDLVKATTDKTKGIQAQINQKIPQLMSSVRQFAKANKPFALGVMSGALIGISTC